MQHNLSDPVVKGNLLSQIRELDGLYRIDIKKWRPRRSDRQNRFYWPAVVQAFHIWLLNEGHSITIDEAHEMLKYKFLSTELADTVTGEIIGSRVRSTTSLQSDEFADYLENCIRFLAEFCGIAVIPLSE